MQPVGEYHRNDYPIDGLFVEKNIEAMVMEEDYCKKPYEY